MSATRSALIIGSVVAVSKKESGASIRVKSIESLLNNLGYRVTVSTKNPTKDTLHMNWDLIAVVSFSSAKTLRAARKKTDFLWFDPTDSWQLTRISQLKQGNFVELFLLVRDLFWIWTSPKLDLITFISDRDSRLEKTWWKNRSTPLILPISELSRKVKESLEPRLVFVGDGQYWPNKKALEYLNRLFAKLPSNLNLHVYGDHEHNSSSKFIFHGHSNNAEIYYKNDIHLAPITTGAGIKLKVATPLANGIRVIATPEGAEGIAENELMSVANSPLEFASLICSLFNATDFHHRESHMKLFKTDETEKVCDRLKTLN